MPIYTFECDNCGYVTETFVTQTEAREGYAPACPNAHIQKVGAPDPVMKRIMSMPASPQLGGAEGKAATAAKIKKRNDAHFKSRSGQDEYRSQVRTAHKKFLGD